VKDFNQASRSTSVYDFIPKCIASLLQSLSVDLTWERIVNFVLMFVHVYTLERLICGLGNWKWCV